MRPIVTVLLLALAALALPISVAAAEPPPWPEVPRDRAALDRFARARYGEARELLTGPTPPQAAPVAEHDCATLYQARLDLMRTQLDHRPDFWNDPRNQAAAVIGAVWSPGFYYLPYRALSSFTRQAGARQATADLDALRARAAALRCFEH